MQIPHHTLEPKTLRRLLSEIVTRDGTDYGDIECSTAEKIDAALHALDTGAAQLLWDAESESASLLSADQVHDEGAALRRLRGEDKTGESALLKNSVARPQETEND